MAQVLKIADDCTVKMWIWSPFWALIIATEILIYGTYGILVDLSKVDGEIPYLSSSVVLCTEMSKFCICLVGPWLKSEDTKWPSLTLQTILPFSVPAVCYCINNNLSIFMQTQMDPATYMVMGNMKILSTAALYRFVMKKSLALLQWTALVLLTCGGVINSWAALGSKSLSLSETHMTRFGLLLLCCYCFLSGFAGVYTEYILKKDQSVSLYCQNALLYMFGVSFNFIIWTAQAYRKSLTLGTNQYLNLFHGYSMFTWVLVISQAICGLLMSLIMKYNNNIVRLFIIATAPLVTTTLSLYIFSLHVHKEFIISTIFIVSAVVLYNLPCRK